MNKLAHLLSISCPTRKAATQLIQALFFSYNVAVLGIKSTNILPVHKAAINQRGLPCHVIYLLKKLFRVPLLYVFISRQRLSKYKWSVITPTMVRVEAL